MIGLNILATCAVIVLVLLGSHSDWPDQNDGLARVVGAAIILLAIWLG